VEGGGILIVAIDAVAREATLFAAIWFLIGGIDDLAVDAVWFVRRLGRRVEPRRSGPRAGRIAIFVGACDESAVIGSMLRTALERLGRGDYRIYVGTYPNDRATIDAVAEVAARNRRVRLVIGPAPGPTTKADNLNTLWRALLRDERASKRKALAVLLHDAEDVVHVRELEVVRAALADYEAVQLPVLPLRKGRFVSGHYLDEFAEAHAKQLPVRQALGAGLPLAGVGCAIRRDMLGRIAAARGGQPFDAASLTEDYELGLTIAATGGRTSLARVPEASGSRRPVAVRAYFPNEFDAAVRQKARWMTGIALAGWDRTGWAAPAHFGDHWMRMRDRRATLAMPVLAVAYCALLLWALSFFGHALSGIAPPVLAWPLDLLVPLNMMLLGWRVAIRTGFVWHAYGWGEARWAAPRMVVANFIALFAARRAALAYLSMLTGAVPQWDKTAHHFPEDVAAATA
jgi:bacteriophage N4 adsorption protein B